MAEDTNELVMPKLGLTMAEGLLAEWRVAEGDVVSAGDVLFIVETDKIANEIEAPSGGRIEAILVPAGETVPVGAPVARWTGVGSIQPALGEESAASPAEKELRVAAHAEPGKRTVATPLARRLARSAGIELAALRGSGPRGRIKAADVERAIAERRPPAQAAATATKELVGRSIELTALETAMARRMSEAKRDIPHFYLSAEADVSALAAFRTAFNAEVNAPHLTVTHFIVAAVAHALAAKPENNRIWDGGIYRILEDFDVGVAIATERGLVAPLLRGAARQSLPEIAGAYDRLVERARGARLSLDDLSGGAITVSNLGMFGVTTVHPIINPPQSMILGVGASRRVLAPGADGAPQSREQLTLVLAADHRVFDGARAGEFLRRIVEGLMRPYRLLAPAMLRAAAP